jgi:hypothetical protein
LGVGLEAGWENLQSEHHLDPKSVIIVFDHNGEISGVIAIDGKKAGEVLGSVLGAEKSRRAT